MAILQLQHIVAAAGDGIVAGGPLVAHDVATAATTYRADGRLTVEHPGLLPAAFVRVMILPRRLLGAPSIRYVRDEDRDRPKSRRYTVYVDEPLP